MTKNQEQILFHSLGYEYTPQWNTKAGGYRNYYATGKECSDYNEIQQLVKEGYMEYNGSMNTSEYFTVTKKGVDFVESEFYRKRDNVKPPTRSQRRYQAYWDWAECYGGTFREFLGWLKITEDMRLFLPHEVKIIEEFKHKWKI